MSVHNYKHACIIKCVLRTNVLNYLAVCMYVRLYVRMYVYSLLYTELANDSYMLTYLMTGCIVTDTYIIYTYFVY